MPDSQTRVVRGQVRRSDNAPFNSNGYIVRAFDRTPSNSLTPLGSPFSLSGSNEYKIDYTWQSTDGRNRPDLVVRLFNPQNVIVAENSKSVAGLDETLPLTVPAPQPLTLSGTVKNQATGAVLPGVSVTVGFQIGTQTIITRSATTDTNGNFSISYDNAIFILPQGQSITVTFQLAQNNQPLPTTTTIPSLQPQTRTIDILATVPEPPEALVIEGTVAHTDGRILTGMVVQAFDRDLRGEQLLGQQATNATGHYRITYNRSQFNTGDRQNNGKSQADIRLKLLDSSQQSITDIKVDAPDAKVETINIKNEAGAIVPIQVIFNAPPVTVANLTVSDARFRSDSEYDRYLRELAPVLQNIPFRTLEETDIDFLTHETEISVLHIAFLRDAENLSVQTDVAAEVFYGLFRQNLPTELRLLVVRSVEELRSALQRSIEENIISDRLESNLDSIINQLQNLLTSYAAGTVGTGSALGNLLSTVLPDITLRQQFVTEYATYDGKDAEVFWNRLQTQPGFQNGLADDIRFTFQVSTLTLNHLPLVQLLQQERRQGRVQTIKELARLDEDAWAGLINTPINDRPVGTPEDVSGADAVEKTRNYATLMTRLAEATFPTVAIAARLEKTDLPIKNDLITFFTNNPEFEINGTPFRRYLNERGNQVLSGVQNPENIAAAQRTYMVAPRFEWMRPLLENNLTSALAITRLGETRFIKGYAQAIGGEVEAKQIYYRADRRTAYGLAWLGKNNLTFDQVRPWVIPPQSPVILDSTLPPNLEMLFGSLTSCECEHCRSVYSPAAYLVDSLAFLNESELLEDFQLRRPDIGSLRLSCKNTNTPLPYIDLVNEILEDVVADWRLEPVNVFQPSLDSTSISSQLREEFARKGHTLSNEAVISISVAGREWVIRDTKRNYIIQVKPADEIHRNPSLRIVWSPQTNWDADELSANPEHINSEAYNILNGQGFPVVYPQGLPFDLWLETVRVYLKYLGSSRKDVIRQFRQGDNPSEEQIVTEILGLSSVERAIIVGVSAIGDTRVLLPQFYDFPSGIPNETLLSTLSHVPALLRRANLTYQEFLDVHASQFVNPGLVVNLNAPDNADCDLSKYTISRLNLEFLDRLHRFLRLRRALGWSISELSLAIAVLGDPDPVNAERKLMNDALLRKLAYVQQLLDDLKLSLEELLSFWGNLNTQGDNPLYLRLFQSKAVTNPVNPDFAVERVNLPETSDSPNIDEAQDIPVILAALRTSKPDLDLLSDAVLNLSLEQNTNPEEQDTNPEQFIDSGKRTLTNLSKLYRYVLLARKLRVKVSELLLLLRMIGDPFEQQEPGSPTRIDPAITVGFIEQVRDIQRSQFKITHLAYLYLHDNDAAAVLEPDDVQLQAITRTLRAGLKNQLTTEEPSNSLEDQLRTELAVDALREPAERLTGIASNQIEEVLAFLRSDQRDTLENRAKVDAFFVGFPNLSEMYSIVLGTRDSQAKFNYILEPIKSNRLKDELKIALGGLLTLPAINNQAIPFLTNPQVVTEESRRIIQRLFGKFLNSEEPQSILLSSDSSVSSKLEYVLNSLLRYLQQRDLVVQTLSDALKLDSKNTRWLLEDFLRAHLHRNRPAIYDFINIFDETVSSDSETISRSLRLSFIKLHKVALLTAGFDLALDELQQFARLEDSDLTRLSLGPIGVNATLLQQHFKQWQQLRLFQILRDRLPKRKVRLIEVFIAASDDGARAKLQEATGWSEIEISDLRFPNDFRSINRLVTLSNQVDLSRRIGVPISQLRTWATEPPSSAQAQQVRQVVKAKYDEKQWITVARPLEDQLREKRREALVAYLTHRPQLWLSASKIAELEEAGRQADANLLYEQLLIDVEMSACQLTSRVRQAIAAVQLFVQRCQMGLEKPLEIQPESARRWETWMKTYRFWEANRKVFVYPENWIEPELRDDKTPFFKDLENALLQNDVTQETVEKAFLRYLEQLSEVARLDIVGMYVQEEEGIIHVFGRTSGIPHRYFYRKLIRLNDSPRWTDGRWTPWEKVELDIEGDHLIPVIWHRRLYLFWVIFTEKAEQAPLQENASSEERQPKKYWEIQLAYSEYRSGQWSARKLLKEKLDSREFIEERLRPIFERNYYSFKPLFSDSDNQLIIRCYGSVYYRPYSFAQGEFRFDRCQASPTVEYTPVAIPLVPTDSTQIDNQNFVEIAYSLSLPENRIAVLPFEVSDSSKRNDFISKLLRNNLRPPNLLAFQRAILGFYRLIIPHQNEQFIASQTPFFYQDNARNFFVTKEIPKEPLYIKESIKKVDPEILGFFSLKDSIYSNTWSANTTQPNLGSKQVDSSVISTLTKYHISKRRERYVFTIFYHPYVCLFLKQLNRDGIDGLLNPPPKVESRAAESEEGKLRRQRNQIVFFENDYDPNRNVIAPEYLDPVENIDFEVEGSYSQYNWELFFHAPLLVADRLMQNQQFAEAQKWFHYIFDPTVGNDLTVDRPDPARFWKIRPFYEIADEPQTVDQLMRALNAGDEKLKNQVNAWRDNPFNPHLIARMRLTAYMKTVVMKYLDNLIAWGDYLFSQDTSETVSEATQAYILAANLLGPQPEIIPPRTIPTDRTFNELVATGLDLFNNALVLSEESLPAFDDDPSTTGSNRPPLPVLYFCIPPNDKLLKYWDMVGDRLFKIRHCMNIEGVVRQLALFDPPIDPAMLVRARALGVDLRDVLSSNVILPHYRFSYILQKANEFCAEIRALGAALLGAYEKRDAEAIARLRSEHEIRLLDAVKEVRQQQILEALEAKAGLEKTKEQIAERIDFYRDIQQISTGEKASMDHHYVAQAFTMRAQVNSMAAAIGHALPNFDVGIAGYGSSPVLKASYGGSQIGSAAAAVTEGFRTLSSQYTFDATMTSTKASYDRRWGEWKLQERLAGKELEQIDKQIAAAEFRYQIAQKELENHDLQRENAREVDSFMRSKFTNQELYDWMVSEVSAIYFQSYQLAFEIARRAEVAYRFERGLTDSNFIRFGQWDSLRRGLMAGERLQLDLRRLEMAYLNENRREYEITKHISLAMLDPLALIQLKQTGQCFIGLPEVLFDLDYPGHYMRRVKSVSLTIPCVTGPYTSVNCILTLLSNKTRISSTSASPYPEAEESDQRFYINFAATQSIATSNAQNDSGLFELNFRDERYLPFEGAGVISTWRIELTGKATDPSDASKIFDFAQFDFDTISDVVMHLRYTARDGGDNLKQEAIKQIQEALESAMNLAESRNGFYRLFSIRNEFPTEWHQFLHSSSSISSNLQFVLSKERFPFLFDNKSIKIKKFEFFLPIKEGTNFLESDGTLAISAITAPNGTIVTQPRPELGTPPLPFTSNQAGVPYASIEIDDEIDTGINPWRIEFLRISENIARAIEDLFVVCHYSIS